MSQACAAWRGDVGAYLVGALGGGARARVIAHLETCAGCRGEYDELVPVRGLLKQLTSLRIESAGGRLLLTIPVRAPGRGPGPPMPMR